MNVGFCTGFGLAYFLAYWFWWCLPGGELRGLTHNSQHKLSVPFS